MFFRRKNQRRSFLPIARGLGVRVESPYLVQNGAGTVQFDAFLPDFGGKQGMVVMLDRTLSFNEMLPITEAAGLYFSALNGNAETSVEGVKATLRDWGYFGAEGTRPEWCNAHP